MSRTILKRKPTVYLLGLLLATIVILIIIWAKYGQRAQSYECTNYAMGTYIQQTVYGRKAEAAATAAAKSIGDLENLISWRVEDSDIAKLNDAAGSDWITLKPKTISLLETSLDVAKESGGAFEPTILPISSLWDFGGENQHVPSSDQIDQYIKYVNYQNLRINKTDSTASLKYHYMAVDLSAIGYGAACDEAIAAYRSAGAECGIVSVGGSVGVYGIKSDKAPWKIALRDPDGSKANSVSIGELELSSGFASTAGGYTQQFTQDGKTYHHLLNPKTGYPAESGLLSVTVISSSGALSDALSTACFVLGKDKGMALLSQYNAQGIFIDQNHYVTVTEGFKSDLKLTDSRYSLAN